MRQFTTLNAIEGIGANGKANANIVCDKRVHAILFRGKSRNAANDADVTDLTQIIKSIKLSVNSKLLVDLDSATVKAIPELNGLSFDEGTLVYFMSEPWRASITGEESTSWDLFGQTKCSLQIEFESDVSAIELEVQLEYDYARNVTVNEKGETQNFLSIVKRRPSNFNAGAGVNDIAAFEQDQPIQRIYVTPSAGTITKGEFFKDDVVVHEATKTVNDERLKSRDMDGSKFPYVFAFDADQQVSSAMVIRRSGMIRVTNSAPGSNSVIVENRSNGYF